MNLRAVSLLALALLPLATSAPAASAADPYSDRTFRVTGPWNGELLRAQRVQLRDALDDLSRGQVSGRVRNLDVAGHRFRIGPIAIEWDDHTRFEKLRPDHLAEGLAVRVSGRRVAQHLRASSIRAADDLGANTVQLTGVATSAREDGDGTRRLQILDTPVWMTQPGYNAVESLIFRQDSRRRDELTRRTLFGRPLGITGEYNLDVRDRRNFNLDDDRVVDTSSEFELGLLYSLTERTALFLSGQVVYEAELSRDGGRRSPSVAFERDQTWIYFDRLGGTGLGLQIGRQNFKEPREWWWDDDLDAIRAYYDHGGLHAEVAVARELARVTTREDFVDPTLDDVVRWIGTVSWLWAPRQKLELFALHADDRSRTEAVGAAVDADRLDPSDARLTWFGARAIGARPVGRWGTLSYWVDSAWVSGREALVSYDGEGDRRVVSGVARSGVNGSGLDLGLSWQTAWPGSPALTVSYARGSGDRDPSDGRDRAFRQTGLHNNKSRYFGVNRFRVYGEVLRPELSNLEIATASIGLPLLTNSSIELSYHRYRQLEPSGTLREARIDADLTGDSTGVGDGLDLVLGLREGSNLDFALTGGVFRAGEAFGARRKESAYLLRLEVAWNF